MVQNSMRTSGTRYILEGRASGETRVARLLHGFDLEFESVSRHAVRYLDTFDWRLYESGHELVVATAGRSWVVSMRERGGRTEIARAATKNLPAAASDIPKGPLREAVGRITGIRALLPIVNASYAERLVRVLNEDKKTVCRLSVFGGGKATLDAESPSRRLENIIQVVSVLGYEKETQRVCQALEEAGLKKIDEDLLDLALVAVGREPLDYSSKPRIILDRDMSMDEALRTVLINLARAMRANEKGLLADTDIEFLHDFRVATRRTRSVVGQFKRGISPAVVKSFRPGFKWLGKVTGPTRDADVYLEHVDGYRSSLPDEVGEQLLPLREFLERKRSMVFKSMIRSLKTKRYEQLMSNWESFLLGTGVEGSGRLHKGQRALPAVSARIWKVYRTIMIRGGAITTGTPATALHNLRLVCKNLRYLLETFRSLYPAKEMNMLINELKSLQNNLGDIQDLEVQRLALDGFAQEMLEEGPVASGTVMAMGRLAASLEERQHAARGEFADRFERFARKKNRRTFAKLFKDQR